MILFFIFEYNLRKHWIGTGNESKILLQTFGYINVNGVLTYAAIN